MKARIIKTGEIVEVISYSGSTNRNECIDRVSYIDSKGTKHDREPLNYYWDFEQMTIDWGQRRYEIAKEIFPTILGWYSEGTFKNEDCAIVSAVRLTDKLIEKLKRE